MENEKIVTNSVAGLEPQSQDKRSSFSEIGTTMEFDSAKEKKLLRKLDLTFSPIFMLLYLSSFLDRSNIGKHGLPIACMCSS